jgi:hypothetical protein
MGHVNCGIAPGELRLGRRVEPAQQSGGLDVASSLVSLALDHSADNIGYNLSDLHPIIRAEVHMISNVLIPRSNTVQGPFKYEFGNVKGTKPVKKSPNSGLLEFIRARQATAYKIDIFNCIRPML